jgi:hypothetical protein
MQTNPAFQPGKPEIQAAFNAKCNNRNGNHALCRLLFNSFISAWQAAFNCG